MERRPAQGRRSPGGRGSAAQWRPTRERGGVNPCGSTRRGPLGARSKGAGRRREVRSPPFPSRSTDSASLAGSEPPPVALARLVSGEMSRLGERRVEDAWATWIAGSAIKRRRALAEVRSNRRCSRETESDDSRSLFLWRMRSCGLCDAGARERRTKRGSCFRRQAERISRPGGPHRCQTKAGGARERRLSGLSSRSRPRREAKSKRVEISKR